MWADCPTFFLLSFDLVLIITTIYFENQTIIVVDNFFYFEYQTIIVVDNSIWKKLGAPKKRLHHTFGAFFIHILRTQMDTIAETVGIKPFEGVGKLDYQQ